MPTWQKNFRRIPDNLQAKVRSLGANDIIVSCCKNIPYSDIRNGVYEHIGITLNEAAEIIIKNTEFSPKAENGRYSRYNAEGYEIVHKDLPKITKTYTWEVPNWGDSYYGTHDISVDREIYKRTWIPPKLLSLQVEILNDDKVANHCTFRFALFEVLNISEPNFHDALYFNLNVLQENVGYVDVYPSSATRGDYLSTLSVSWEILPPGDRDDIVNKILRRFRTSSPELRDALLERYDILEALGPINWVNGTSGFRRYFGAQFRDDLVVFENLQYGNAIYIMFEDWMQLSQLSRIDLMNSNKRGFRRLVHGRGWQQQLRSYITGLLDPQQN